MKRVLAVLVAVGLIAGAYVLRTRVIRPDEDPDVAGSETPDVTAPPEAGLVVVCATELGDACRELADADVRVESAGATADALVALARGQSPDFAVWVTGASWPGLVDELRRAAGLPALFPSEMPVIARSRLALAIEEGRQEALEAVCAEVAWDCLATAVGRPWSELGADAPRDVPAALTGPHGEPRRSGPARAGGQRVLRHVAVRQPGLRRCLPRLADRLLARGDGRRAARAPAGREPGRR